MPSWKRSFAYIKGVEPAAAQQAAARLKKIAFGINSDMQVIGVDQDYPRLAVEAVARRNKSGYEFNEAEGKFVEAKGHDYRRHYFELDLDKSIGSTTGSSRDFSRLVELLKRAGLSAAELVPLRTDLSAWTAAFVKLQDAVQLGNITYDNHFSEKQQQLIGRFSAKSVDNRFHLGFIAPESGTLLSVRLAYFHEGVRRSVEVRAAGVLALTSSDEDDLADFAADQQKLMLQHSYAVEE